VEDLECVRGLLADIYYVCELGFWGLCDNSKTGL
jgi:hypothetical protein